MQIEGQVPSTIIVEENVFFLLKLKPIIYLQLVKCVVLR